MDVKYDFEIKNDFLINNTENYVKSNAYTKILYVKSGISEIILKENPVLLNEGDSVIIPPFSTFQPSDISKNTAEFSYLSYFIHKNNFAFPKNTSLICKSSSDELSKTLKDFFSIYIINSDIDYLLKKSLEYKILYHAEKAIEKSDRNIHPKLLPLISFIENNYSQNFTTADLARSANISESGVYKLFTAYSNKSPKQYIRECRLSHAVNLLLNSTKPIAGIALETGFYDQFYFSKEFKKEFGVSPSEYRKLKKD